MRLICPNCDAQYDVADDAIPVGGRDVQCSSCAHSWYQTEKPVVEGRSESKVASKASPADDKADKPQKSGYDTPQSRSAGHESPGHEQAPKHRPIDPTVAKILREEAALNQQIDQTETETPPATSEGTTRHPKIDTDETLKRIAEMTELEGGTRAGNGTNAVKAAAMAAAATANPRAVPDIGEINAALRARAEASDDSGLTEAEHDEAVQRRGFRFGFFTVLLILIVLILPYIFSDAIVANLPQTSDPMTAYVSMIDQLRVSFGAFANRLYSAMAEVTG